VAEIDGGWVNRGSPCHEAVASPRFDQQARSGIHGPVITGRRRGHLSVKYLEQPIGAGGGRLEPPVQFVVVAEFTLTVGSGFTVTVPLPLFAQLVVPSVTVQEGEDDNTYS
jgi:hypothetical protein